MEENSSSTDTVLCYTSTHSSPEPIPRNHLCGTHLYATFKSKSSVLVLLGCVVLVALSYIALFSTSAPNNNSALTNYAPFHISPRISNLLGISPVDDDVDAANTDRYKMRLKEVFERAAMPNRTVIITALNAAWAEEGTMIDLFLEGFSQGDDTLHLLRHLVIVCVDDKAYQRCLAIHPHCVYIKTPGVNFSGEQLLLSADYIKLMWRRIKFLHTVLEMDYSFIFTDTDVLWFRNPLPQLHTDTEADFQIACDHYNGRPRDVQNNPNAGFVYVRANARTLRFYQYWYDERERGSHMADQEVLNAIKFDREFRDIGMKLRFLDMQFFGGFCGLTYTDMTKALTMHATCCKGQEAKLIDLRMLLDGWKKWHAVNLTMYSTASTTSTSAQIRDGSTATIAPSASSSSQYSLENASSPQLAPDLPPHDIVLQNVEMINDPRFKLPVACPLSWWQKH